MDKENPKISVIMAVFNAEKYLRDAMDSILAQTYGNWEFVICNDGSTDETQAILDEYSRLYPGKFILLRNETNRRLPYSLNRCLENCTGELIARMDGDDVSDPLRFEKQVRFLQSHPGCQLVGTQMVRFDKDGLHDIVSCSENPSPEELRFGVTFCHATIMTYKSVYDRLGGYNTSIPRSQDYELWFRFYHAGFKGRNIQEPLYHVREDANAVRRRTIRNRYHIMKIQFSGYRMLHFPLHWYVLPPLLFLKAFVPGVLVLLYRRLQRR